VLLLNNASYVLCRLKMFSSKLSAKHFILYLNVMTTYAISWKVAREY